MNILLYLTGVYQYESIGLLLSTAKMLADFNNSVHYSEIILTKKQNSTSQ